MIPWVAFFGGALAATPPAVLEPVSPEYPAAAVADRVTGTVVVRLEIDAAGAVASVTVVEGVREDVDAAALEAAYKLRFQPAEEGGAAVPSAVDYAFTFALEVGDEQGNPVPASLDLVFTDPDGLPVPGVKVTLRSRSGEVRALSGGDNGVAHARFLPPERWEVRVEREGFAPASLGIALGQGETRRVNVLLTPAGPVEEIVVVGARQRWREVTRAPREPVLEPVTGSYTLTRRDVESTPGALEDVSRAVHKLPGVISDGDMLGAFSVRGHAPEEVVYLLDRVPLDNPFHLAGFNSIFNPDMLSEVHFFAAAAPSEYPDGTSAVMDVRSWDGAPKDDRHDLDGALDLSMGTARVLLLGPIGKGDDLTFALAARRSYLESYFWLMKGLNLLDVAVVAPEYDELSARLRWKLGQHKLTFTGLRAGDHLALVDSEDQSLINIEGTFRLDNVLYLGLVDHRWEAGSGAAWQSTLSWSLDQAYLERDFGGAVTQDIDRTQLYARTDLDLPVGEHTLQTGASAQVRRAELAGPVEDTRALPSFVAAPIGDTGLDLVEVDPGGWEPRTAVYAEHGWTGPVRTRAGLRATHVGDTGELLLSPSGGLSIPLPTATVPKVAAGLYHHVVDDPLVNDPELGNPDLRAERALQLVVGLDQALPIAEGAFLRVEVFHSWLDRLVVKPDTAEAWEAGQSYANDGTGRDLGADLLFAAKGGRWSAVANVSLLHAKRTNPLNTYYAQTVTPPKAQAVTAGASLEWQLTERWRLTGRYDFHTGRPMSSVEPAGLDTIRLVGLNDQRLGPFHQVDLRGEWRKATPWLRWSLYLEVLNAFYFQSDFLPIVTVEDGELSETMLPHLPSRPFLGLRVDF